MTSRQRSVLIRLLQSIPVIIGVVIISFVLTRALPGDPAAYFAGAAADEASIAEIR
jgi:peptide/nickel transport system permease protein